jgi:hypothetical protein
VLLWNERRITGNPFLDDYERLLHRYCAEYKDKRHGQTAPIAQAFFSGVPYHQRVFDYQQEFDFAGLTGRLLSSSYCPLPGDSAHAPMMQELERVFHTHARQNTVRIDYDTRVFFGQLHPAE